MSEPQTLDLTEPVEQNVEEVVEEVPSSDAAAEETPEEPVEAPTEVAEPEVSEEPVEPVVTEEPEVAEEPVEAEEPVVAEEPVAVEQVASDIRNILSDPVPVTESNNLCSLKTLIDVLTKWTDNKIHHSKVEQLLQEGTETDENLDNLEKFIEIFKILLTSGSGKIKENNSNLFSKIDDYSLTTTVNITGERSQVLGELIDLTIKKSKYEYKRQKMLDILNNL